MSRSRTERVPVMFDKDLVKRIDDYSFRNRIRTRSEAIRRLISQSLICEENEKADATA